MERMTRMRVDIGFIRCTLLLASFNNNPARQNATAAIPCASTAKNGGVSRV